MTMRIRAGLAVLAVALPTPAFTQDAPPFTLEGVYRFQTEAQQDGRPVCSEVWTFGRDGAMAVESGQERVRKRFRTETDRDGTWIVAETLETNGAPDCMGQRTPDVSPGERRTYVVPINSGVILTCPPPQRMSDGTPYISSCYGAIIPAGRVGQAGFVGAGHGPEAGAGIAGHPPA